MGLNYYASSPVLLPPQNPNHHLASRTHIEGGATLEPAPAVFQQQLPFPPKKFVPKYPTPPSLNYLARVSNGVAGRKRSREDVTDDIESELDASTRPISIGARPEPLAGPAMTLGFPPQRASISQDSQSGIWMEEMDQDPQSSASGAARPRMVARKSQRRLTDGPIQTNNQEEIDPIVMQLGIGWKRPTQEQQAAVAGSETFIKKQFPLNEPRIVLHHEGLGIYVVCTEPTGARGYWQQWWLFRDDLKSCRFLCNDESDLFRRLNHKRQDDRGNWIPDILAEGPEVFAKDVPPSPVTALSPINGVMVADNVERMRAQLAMSSEDVEME